MSARLSVRAEDLVKTYPGDVQAVKGISFGVESGEAFGLLGPNGAGKTTTVGMLNTTVTPTSGRAILAGKDVAVDPMGTRAISSVVFQDAVVDQPLSGRQNLQLHAKLWGIDPEIARPRITDLARSVDLIDILDRPVATYSGGQRRRLEIIRALVSEPQVLFLDEPTVGLDTRIRHDLFDAITTLREKTAVTVIMTTHYLDEAERLCDRLAIIDSGVMVACDTPADLLASMGQQILEVRIADPGRLVRLLRDRGVAEADILVIGGSVTVSLKTISASEISRLLEENPVGIRSSTTRAPSLDDVYLRLTGGRMTESTN
jgi:ABC-2 type transport system ATP-binding protein